MPSWRTAVPGFYYVGLLFFTGIAFGDEVTWQVGGRAISAMENVYSATDGLHSIQRAINLNDSRVSSIAIRPFSNNVTAAMQFSASYQSQRGEVDFLTTEIRSPYFEVTLGRARLENFAVAIPTLYDHDFIDYGVVSNAFSDREQSQLFGSQVRAIGYLDSRYANHVVASLVQRDNDTNSPSAFNAAIVGYRYESVISPASIGLRKAAILLDGQNVNAPETKWMYSIIAGVDLGLLRKDQSAWSLVAQTIFNMGTGSIDVSTRAKTALAESVAFAGALRYTRYQSLVGQWQSALNVGVKRFPHVDDSMQWTIAPTAVIRVSTDFDCFTQARYSRRNAVLGQDDLSILMGVSISFGNIEKIRNENSLHMVKFDYPYFD